MYRILLLAAAVTATGCLPQQLALKPNDSVRDSAVYGSVPAMSDFFTHSWGSRSSTPRVPWCCGDGS